MRRRFERPYLALLTAAALWTAFNCIDVYFALGEGAAYRIESAAIILAVLAIPWVVLRGRTSPSPPLGSSAADRLAFAALAVLWLAVLGPHLSYPFLSDDYGFLAAYRTFADTVRPFQFYRPAFAGVVLVLARLGDGSPALFHATAFALHLASSWLVYRLARRLTSGPALVAAALFLLNPAQLEAVLWVSGLQEVLWTFFLLAALVLWTVRERVSRARMAGAVVLIAAALWSKETAVCVVFLLPVVELAAFGARRLREAAVLWGVTAGECALYLLLRSRAVAIDDTFFVTPSHYFFKQMLVIPYEVFIHPWNRTALDVPRAVLCATALGVLGLLAGALWRGPSKRALVGPAIIVASVLPVYSMFYVGSDLADSRYLYFGAAGFGVLVAELIGRIPSLPRAAALSAVSIALAWSLALNLRPWRASADLVAALQEAVLAGEDPTPVIQTWQATHAPGLVLKEGIPDSYQGVWVFRNGYAEFVARSRH